MPPDSGCGDAGPCDRCECDEGFVGDGFVCKRPVAFVAKKLLPSMPSVQAADLHMAGVRDTLIVAFRDIATEKGYLLLGHVKPSNVEWSEPIPFTEGAAYSPQVAGGETCGAQGSAHFAAAVALSSFS